jgi:serine/threonine protein kinase
LVSDTRNEVAAKVVSKKGLDKDQIGWIREEIAIHKRLRHPYICTLHGSFKSLSNIMICLSLCRGGSLVDMMGAMLHAGELLAAAHVHGAFVQLLSALRYLESVGFVHTPRPQA